MTEELKLIKKFYGEEMMHLCRSLFPTILEKPGLLFSILQDKIAPTRYLAFDIKSKHQEESFKNYVYSFVTLDQDSVFVDKTPSQLLSECGYILYECHTEDDIQRFRHYYAKGEELCTFEGGRLDSCFVFFAVRTNVDDIKRENFENPSRQDEYGTSVISIQFSRGKLNRVSIKNRYNHTVYNPDATFSNNLDNIIVGLTRSFEQYYGLNIVKVLDNQSLFFSNSLPYVLASDGKYYRYNHMANDIYYCENNIIVDNGIVIDKYSKEKERYIIIDHFILDKKAKKVFLYDKDIKDIFVTELNQFGNIKNIVSTKDKTIIIEYINGSSVYISINGRNNIVSQKNIVIDSSIDAPINPNNLFDDNNILDDSNLTSNGQLLSSQDLLLEKESMDSKKI